MNWIYLFLAGLLEIGWVLGLKLMDQHKNVLWTLIFYLSLISSFYFLQLALKHIPVGTAYAVYTSIGAIGTVVAGMFLFKEPVSLLRIGSLFLVLIGVAGLKLSSNH